MESQLRSIRNEIKTMKRLKFSILLLIVAFKASSQLSQSIVERIAPIPGLETDFIAIYKTEVQEVVPFDEFNVDIAGLYDFEFVNHYPTETAIHVWDEPGMYHIVGYNEDGEYPYFGMWYMVDESLVQEKRRLNPLNDFESVVVAEQILFVGDLNYPEYRCSAKLHNP